MLNALPTTRLSEASSASASQLEKQFVLFGETSFLDFSSTLLGTVHRDGVQEPRFTWQQVQDDPLLQTFFSQFAVEGLGVGWMLLWLEHTRSWNKPSFSFPQQILLALRESLLQISVGVPVEATLSALPVEVSKAYALTELLAAEAAQGAAARASSAAFPEVDTICQPSTLVQAVHSAVVEYLSTVCLPAFNASDAGKRAAALLQARDKEVAAATKLTHSDFVWIGRLGKGGYSSVYVVLRKSSGRVYAAKVMDKRKVKQKRAIRLISLERQALKAISSPYVAELSFSYECGNEAVFVSELAPCRDLEWHVRDARRTAMVRDARLWLQARAELQKRRDGCLEACPALDTVGVLYEAGSVPPVWQLDQATDALNGYTPGMDSSPTAAEAVSRVYASAQLRAMPSRALPEQTVRVLLAEIAMALGGMHACGIAHRDVKPSNMLVDAHGRAILSDLGLAAFVGNVRLRAEAVQALQRYHAMLGQLDQVYGKADPGQGVVPPGSMIMSPSSQAAPTCAAVSQVPLELPGLLVQRALLPLDGAPNIPIPAEEWPAILQGFGVDDYPVRKVSRRIPILVHPEVLPHPMHSPAFQVMLDPSRARPSRPAVRDLVDGADISHLCYMVRPFVRGRAGTPGYWAPEVLQVVEDDKAAPYDGGVDWWSFGCFMYTALCGRSPFYMHDGTTSDENDATLGQCHISPLEPEYDPRVFSPQAADLCAKLLRRDPRKRLGCGPGGIVEVLTHPFFAGLDLGALQAADRHTFPSAINSRTSAAVQVQPSAGAPVVHDPLSSLHCSPPPSPGLRTVFPAVTTYHNDPTQSVEVESLQVRKDGNELSGHESASELEPITLTAEDHLQYKDFGYCSQAAIDREIIDSELYRAHCLRREAALWLMRTAEQEDGQREWTPAQSAILSALSDPEQERARALDKYGLPRPILGPVQVQACMAGRAQMGSARTPEPSSPSDAGEPSCNIAAYVQRCEDAWRLQGHTAIAVLASAWDRVMQQAEGKHLAAPGALSVTDGHDSAVMEVTAAFDSLQVPFCRVPVPYMDLVSAVIPPYKQPLLLSAFAGEVLQMPQGWLDVERDMLRVQRLESTSVALARGRASLMPRTDTALSRHAEATAARSSLPVSHLSGVSEPSGRLALPAVGTASSAAGTAWVGQQAHPPSAPTWSAVAPSKRDKAVVLDSMLASFQAVQPTVRSGLARVGTAVIGVPAAAADGPGASRKAQPSMHSAGSTTAALNWLGLGPWLEARANAAGTAPEQRVTEAGNKADDGLLASASSTAPVSAPERSQEATAAGTPAAASPVTTTGGYRGASLLTRGTVHPGTGMDSVGGNGTALTVTEIGGRNHHITRVTGGRRVPYSSTRTGSERWIRHEVNGRSSKEHGNEESDEEESDSSSGSEPGLPDGAGMDEDPAPDRLAQAAHTLTSHPTAGQGGIPDWKGGFDAWLASQQAPAEAQPLSSSAAAGGAGKSAAAAMFAAGYASHLSAMHAKHDGSEKKLADIVSASTSILTVQREREHTRVIEDGAWPWR